MDNKHPSQELLVVLAVAVAVEVAVAFSQTLLVREQPAKVMQEVVVVTLAVSHLVAAAVVAQEPLGLTGVQP